MIDKVTASFRCWHVQDYEQTVQFMLSASDAPEWTDYTPGGNLNISIFKDKPASKFFEQGKTYKLTFEAE